jgi:phage tail sheath protein FI
MNENERRTMNELRAEVQDMLDLFTFGPVDDGLLKQVKTQLNTMLRKKQHERKIDDYKVVCDETNNPMAGDITVDVIVRVEPMTEFIYLPITLTQSTK